MAQRQNRSDLSDWVIHFVHDRIEKDDLYAMAELTKEEFGTRMQIPCYFDRDGKPHDLTDEYADNEFPIDDNATAFEILKKILHDGFIRSGWSLRNDNPTIYGPYSAVCFTEMPLHALIQYAKDRGAMSGYVGSYGIAFKRKELFAAGARPVIYGLTNGHKEANSENDKNYAKGLRCLSDTTDLGLEEQYRYVYTNLCSTKSTDWMHEREWRWPLNKAEEFSLPGMPFLLSDCSDFTFTEVVVIVCTDDEQQEVMLQLKNQYDSGGRNCGIEYDTKLIPAIRIISLETLRKNNINSSIVRIEDIPNLQTRVNVDIQVSEHVNRRIKEVYEKAIDISNIAQKEYLQAHPDYKEPPLNWGHAYVCTTEISEATQALLNAGYASTYSDGIYMMRVGNYHGPDEDLCALGAKAAADFMETELQQHFYVITMPD